MSEARILTVDEALNQSIAWPDLYFSPAYGAAVEHSDGARWIVATGLGGAILCPLLLRPVAPELTDGEHLFDAVSPYGYAGTFVDDGVSTADWRSFRASLRSQFCERGVVTEFQRLGSLVPGRERSRESCEGEVVAHNETIVVPLERGVDAAFAAAEGRHRTSFRKAIRLGYTFAEAQATLDDLGEDAPFRVLYEGTMRRVGSRPYYLFPQAYYDALWTGLGASLRLGRVLDPSGEVAAAALFVRWGTVLHYHLSGSRPDAARDGANNLLLHGALDAGYSAGMRRLHLGGGLGADDALFRFKRSLGGAPLPFWMWRVVHMPERYEALVQRRAQQTGRSAPELDASGYFPAFRA